MFCPKCGANVPDASAFCPGCSSSASPSAPCSPQSLRHFSDSQCLPQFLHSSQLSRQSSLPLSAHG
ncbi:MAG: zinc-ribbon domain-containing protein [Ruminococcaceae bacterium]|nr:zinc-ribbon domain-containing protein [Oscillospiraceae bacterium]